MAKYPKFLMEHFQDPKNVGEISNPDGVGTVGQCLLRRYYADVHQGEWG